MRRSMASCAGGTVIASNVMYRELHPGFGLAPRHGVGSLGGESLETMGA